MKNYFEDLATDDNTQDYLSYIENKVILRDFIRKRYWFFFSKRYHAKRRKITALCLILSLFFISFFPTFHNLLLNFSLEEPTYLQNSLYVHFIDVGQGKAIAIRTADNKNILIDCGSQTEHHKFFCYLEQKFFIGDNDKKVFDLLILTHMDVDHIGNFEALFEKYEIKHLIRPFTPTQQTAFETGVKDARCINNSILNQNLEKAIKNEKCKVDYCKAGTQISTVAFDLFFYGPVQDYYSSTNGYSPIMHFLHKTKTQSFSFLFTGDATENNEFEVLRMFQNFPKCDVLDVAHHGSNTSSSAEFLNAVQPRFAIISVDIENSSNLPSNDTIERLQASGVQRNNILQTTQGSIVFSVVNDELTYVIQSEINLFHSNHSLALSSIFAFVIILLCCAFVGKPYKIPLFECRPL